MSAHTPGPWECVTKITASENHRGFFVRAEKQERNGKWALAEVKPADEDGITGKANASLIAAAPELLEALQSLIDMDVAYQRGPKVSDAVDKARSAISKATGAE